MAKGLRYDDALKLLGAGQSKTLAAIDAILDGALLGSAAATASPEIVGLFDAKSQLVKHGHALLAKLGQRARGVRGQSRMDLLTAAHTVIVLTAFFESMPEPAGPGVTLAQQLAVASVPGASRKRLVDGLLRTEVPVPLPHLTQDMNRSAIADYYVSLSTEIHIFFYTEVDLSRATDGLLELVEGARRMELAASALRRYDELFLLLCHDCPEFALWSIFREQSAGRAELRSVFERSFGEMGSHFDTALDGLRVTLDRLVSAHAVPDWSERLSRHYRKLLDAPIADISTAGSLAGLRMPSLGRAYVNPSCRVAEVDASASVASDSWWAERHFVDDVQVVLTAHLTSPAATTAPLVLLGQPGSGKSVLTKILVAGLPSGDFLPVRVELRQVPAEDDVQDHVEYAVREATGRAAAWPDVVAGGGGALPIVILDGFDELLQTSRVTQSNYLEKLRNFQHREAGQGRPLAVIVTSRTVVADRVRYPVGTVAVRLESFSPLQIARWLEIWNDANGAHLAARGLRQLTAADAARHDELASQPLLLLMLALYDADANRLPREGAALNQAELYERLLGRFVRREVGKDRALDERSVEQEVAQELHRLSIVAFAMFNRSRQYVHDDEVDADLQALVPAPRRQQATSLARTYSEGQLMVGRFFFVHESVATHGSGDRASTYEFLHATFGEYLVARLVARLAADLARRATVESVDLYPTAPDDSRLHAMLSWTPLTSRYQVVAFLRELLAADGTERPAVLLRLFRQPDAGPRPADLALYRPTASSAGARSAIYQANLLILLLCFGPARCSDLIASGDDCVPAWQRLAHLWRAHCDWAEWTELIQSVRVQKEWREGGRDLRISLPPNFLPDPTYRRDWWFAGEGPDPSEARITYHHSFLCEAGGDRLLDTVGGMPSEYHLSTDVGPRGQTLARVLVELRMGEAGPDKRMECYREAMALIDRVSPDSAWRLLVEELRRDLRRNPAQFTLLVNEFVDAGGQLSTLDARLRLAILVVEEIACWDDPLDAMDLARRCGVPLLPDATSRPDLYPEYLRLWVAYLEAGVDPVADQWSWHSANALVHADIGRIAWSHPWLLVRIVRAVARTGIHGGSTASRVAAALPRLRVSALNQLTEAEVSTVAACGTPSEAAEALTAWRVANGHLGSIGL